MTKLFMVRHGQTLFNLKKQIQGACDSPLTPLGIEQARITQQYFRLRKINFTAAFSSTSERACDTLEIISSLPYQRLKVLKEWNFGMFEGEHEYLNPKLPYGNFFAAYGGETEMEFSQRFCQGVMNLMQVSSAENVLLVTHGACCSVFRQKWDHLAVEELQLSKHLLYSPIGNCTIFEYEFDNNNFRLVNIVNLESQQAYITNVNQK